MDRWSGGLISRQPDDAMLNRGMQRKSSHEVSRFVSEIDGSNGCHGPSERVTGDRESVSGLHRGECGGETLRPLLGIDIVNDGSPESIDDITMSR